ncbi:hypothetical protein ACFSEO_10980 [Agromyces cerinus subsp. nitratus]|uniref:hypothetical protein n=1 Tax=Agromyces cerinus TaxID=33878 RepID=UPI00362D67AA
MFRCYADAAGSRRAEASAHRLTCGATSAGRKEAGRRTPLGARPLGAANIGARGYCGRPRQF